MGSNLTHEGLSDTIESMKRSNAKKPEIEEVHKDWNRLAKFMAGNR